LEPLAPTLKHLWVSYNEIDSFECVKTLVNLEVFYAANNSITKIDNINVLSNLQNLSRLSFQGNPFVLKDGDVKKQEEIPGIKEQIAKRMIKSTVVVDGEPITLLKESSG
jgi:Leucine-rich repeat (LRR) protein